MAVLVLRPQEILISLFSKYSHFSSRAYPLECPDAAKLVAGKRLLSFCEVDFFLDDIYTRT